MSLAGCSLRFFACMRRIVEVCLHKLQVFLAIDSRTVLLPAMMHYANSILQGGSCTWDYPTARVPATGQSYSRKKIFLQPYLVSRLLGSLLGAALLLSGGLHAGLLRAQALLHILPDLLLVRPVLLLRLLLLLGRELEHLLVLPALLLGDARLFLPDALRLLHLGLVDGLLLLGLAPLLLLLCRLARSLFLLLLSLALGLLLGLALGLLLLLLRLEGGLLTLLLGLALSFLLCLLLGLAPLLLLFCRLARSSLLLLLLSLARGLRCGGCRYEKIANGLRCASVLDSPRMRQGNTLVAAYTSEKTHREHVLHSRQCSHAPQQ